MVQMMMMWVSPAFVSQQDEEQETEDAGKTTVNGHQKSRGRAIGSIAATTLTCRRRHKQGHHYNNAATGDR